MTTTRCGFCPLDGCGEGQNCPLRQKAKPGRVALNVLGGVLLVGTASAYDTTAIPLWAAGLDLGICALFLLQLLPAPAEVTK